MTFSSVASLSERTWAGDSSASKIRISAPSRIERISSSSSLPFPSTVRGSICWPPLDDRVQNDDIRRRRKLVQFGERFTFGLDIAGRYPDQKSAVAARKFLASGLPHAGHLILERLDQLSKIGVEMRPEFRAREIRSRSVDWRVVAVRRLSRNPKGPNAPNKPFPAGHSTGRPG